MARASAEKQRAYRERKRAGLLVGRVTVPDSLAETLVELGRLRSSEAEMSSSFWAAVERLLKDIAEADHVSVTR